MNASCGQTISGSPRDRILPFGHWKTAEWWIFQQNNKFEHSPSLVVEWYHNEKSIHNRVANAIPLYKFDSASLRWGTESDWGQKFSYRDALYAVIKVIWHSVPDSTFEKLVDSISRRSKAVINNNGLSSKYGQWCNRILFCCYSFNEYLLIFGDNINVLLYFLTTEKRHSWL